MEKNGTYAFLGYLILGLVYGLGYSNYGWETILAILGWTWLLVTGILFLFGLLAQGRKTAFWKYCIVTGVQFISLMQFPLIAFWFEFDILGLLGIVVHLPILYLGYKLMAAIFPNLWANANSEE